MKKGMRGEVMLGRTVIRHSPASLQLGPSEAELIMREQRTRVGRDGDKGDAGMQGAAVQAAASYFSSRRAKKDITPLDKGEYARAMNTRG